MIHIIRCHGVVLSTQDLAKIVLCQTDSLYLRPSNFTKQCGKLITTRTATVLPLTWDH